MALYAGIDLHSNNNVVVIQDEDDKVIGRRRLRNDLETVASFLEPHRDDLAGVVVESTYNWYWLVDGLQEQGYPVHLANTVAIQHYSGMKYRDDLSDARWLAKLLRLGELEEGYIYPRKERAIRDLLRKRGQLVRHATTHLLSIQSQYARHRGRAITATRVKQLTPADVEHDFEDDNVALAVKANLHVMHCLLEQAELLEDCVHGQVRLRDGYRRLCNIPGIGVILASTIMLETGDISRFSHVGRYVSYARLVASSGRSLRRPTSRSGTI